MAALRALPDVFEVVGVVETDIEWKRKRGGLEQYEGLCWMTEEELFNTPGLDAVTVETDVCGLVAAAWKCVNQNLHIHMEKPGGEEPEPLMALLRECERKKTDCSDGVYVPL